MHDDDKAQRVEQALRQWRPEDVFTGSVSPSALYGWPNAPQLGQADTAQHQQQG
jgi:hypothetical protein